MWQLVTARLLGLILHRRIVLLRSFEIREKTAPFTVITRVTNMFITLEKSLLLWKKKKHYLRVEFIFSALIDG